MIAQSGCEKGTVPVSGEDILECVSTAETLTQGEQHLALRVARASRLTCRGAVVIRGRAMERSR